MTITEEQLHQLVDTINIGCTACPVIETCHAKDGLCFELIKGWLEANT